MKNKTLKIALALMLVLILGSASYATEINEKVKSTQMSMVIEARLMEVNSYLINGTTYLKLRDIAALLKDTDISFDMQWDSNTRQTKIVPGNKYTGDLDYDYLGKNKAKIAKSNEMILIVNGKKHTVKSYLIDESNHVKLRDIIPLIGAKLDWEDETSTIHITSPKSNKSLSEIDLGSNRGDNKLFATDYTLYFGQNPRKGVYKIGDRLYYSFENLNSSRNLGNLVRNYESILDGNAYESLSFVPSLGLSSQERVLEQPDSFIEDPYMGMVKPIKRYLTLQYGSNNALVKNALYGLDDHMVLVDLKALDQVMDVRYDHANKSIHLFEDVQPKGSVDLEVDYVNNALKSLDLKGKTNSQKLETIHDFIVVYLEYDTSFYGYASDRSEDRYEASQKYNFVNNITLASKTGVCEDYSFLLEEMATRVGIPTTYQRGYSNGQAHLWNRVFINDKWRFVDATWNDPISATKDLSAISRTYYDPSLEMLYRSHYWVASDYNMDDYDPSWQNLVNQVADTPQMYRKIVIANMKNKNPNFVVKVKNKSAYGGVGFVTYYIEESVIDYYSLSALYDAKISGYRFNVEYTWAPGEGWGF